jgi:NAD(P)-dependent dehydrogenase (short-subunit alcohol dehydrogenase family)
VAADVREAGQVQAAIDRAGRAGGLRVCVVCAGTSGPGSLSGPPPPDELRTIVEVNLIGTFHVIRLAAAAMRENEPWGGERGVIINAASIAAYDGERSPTATRRGTVGPALPVAGELAGALIRSVAIAPGLCAARPDYASLAAHVADNAMGGGEVIRLDGALLSRTSAAT